MDLVAQMIRDSRNATTFTVVTKKSAWERNEVGLMVFHLNTEVYQHPQHPSSLIIFGKFQEDDVAKALSTEEFDLQVLTGYDNPDLPFRPPTF